MSRRPDSYVLEQKTFHDTNNQSIRSNGLREYNCNASIFSCIKPDADYVPEEVERIAKRILGRYQHGVAFIDTEWKGDAALQPQANFTAKNSDNIIRLYDCLSNEMILSDSGFRQTTKGREIRLPKEEDK